MSEVTIDEKSKLPISLLVVIFGGLSAVIGAIISYSSASATTIARVHGLETQVEQIQAVAAASQISLTAKIDRLTEVVLKMDGTLSEMQRQDSIKRARQ